jgi:hypothetical protein
VSIRRIRVIGLLGALAVALAGVAVQGTPDPVPTPRNNEFYDLAWAKALIADDYAVNWDTWDGMTGLDGTALRYRETDRVSLGNGAVAVYFDFRAFTHEFFDDDPLDGPTKTLPWKQQGILCVPAMTHIVAPGFAKRGVMLDVQVIDTTLEPPHPFNKYYLDAMCRALTKSFEIPFFIHGWEADVVDEAYGANFHESQQYWIERALEAFDADNVTDVEDLVRSDYERILTDDVLAKGNMVALSAFQALVDREAELSPECEMSWGTGECTPGRLEKVAAAGISKSGRAMWLLGAVDDRVEVLVPMGYFAEDRAAYIDDIITDWNCDISHIAEQSLYESILRLGDWARDTAAGQHWTAHDSVLTWQSELYPAHVLIGGDIGKPNFHDNAFPVMAENDFLTGFTHPSWRYARFFDDNTTPDYQPETDALGATWQSNLLYAADLLLNGASTVPTTPTTSAAPVPSAPFDPTAPCTNATGCGVKLSMSTGNLTAGISTEIVLLYLVSDSRHRRDATTAAQWATASSGVYTHQTTSATANVTIGVPKDKMLTYMWVVRQARSVNTSPNQTSFWRSASSIPKEAFPLPNNSCTLPDWRP